MKKKKKRRFLQDPGNIRVTGIPGKRPRENKERKRKKVRGFEERNSYVRVNTKLGCS